MIVTREKPLDEILGYIWPFTKILIAGCDGCVHPPRGLREAKTYALMIEMAGKAKGKQFECIPVTVAKQCDNNIVYTSLQSYINEVDAVLSLACGVGVQVIVEVFPDIPVFPAQNTVFIGSQPKEGAIFYEKCRACGECLLGYTGGICPVTRCAKSLLNGPCGGQVNGKCEVGGWVRDCAWYLIYQRLKKLGRLDLFEEFRPPRDQRVASSPREVGGLVR